MPKVEQVIISYIARGKGTDHNPVRRVLQVHTLNGNLLAENDDTMRWTDAEMIEFANHIIEKHFTQVSIDYLSTWITNKK